MKDESPPLVVLKDEINRDLSSFRLQRHRSSMAIHPYQEGGERKANSPMGFLCRGRT
jgi:hypothetical protein